MHTVQKGGIVLPWPTAVPGPDEIHALMTSCCEVEPEKRPNPQRVVRSIRTLLTRGRCMLLIGNGSVPKIITTHTPI